MGGKMATKRQKKEYQSEDDELGAAAEQLLMGYGVGDIGLQGKLVMRQKRGRTGTQKMITDEQRKIEILNRVRDPNYKRENKKRQE